VSTLARYALLQIPGWVVTIAVLAIPLELGFISFRVAATLFGLLLLKDAIVYPFVRRAYDPTTGNRVDDLIGHLAEVRRDLSPEGLVRLRGELWWAETDTSGGPISVGDRVRVVGTRGFTLLVEPAGDRKPDDLS
jgi:membrane-bound serine protease (ClpP class)